MISPPHTNLKSGYRPEIDGLRAIAILSVVIYHTSIALPGGYVGVDLFFVISGYLITSIILRDFRRGSFSFVGFWERRIRRIFPAAAVCVSLTLVAGWFLLLPEDLESLGKSAVAQALLVSNFFFWRTTNYFGGDNAEKPLLHTWSLAVEEQFYLLLPLALFCIFRFAKWKTASRLALVFGVCAVISLGLSVVGLIFQPFATFFLLPTRAWELLIGSLVALASDSQFPPRSRVFREALSWGGLVAILLPVFLYSSSTSFPGLAALPPCLGAAMIILGNGRDPGGRTRNTTVSVMLSCRPMVFIGLISYSFYLYHFPVIAFANYWKIQEFGFREAFLMIVVSFLLAVLSWRFVESPYRQQTIGKTRKSIGFQAALSSSLILLVGIVFWWFKGVPERLEGEVLLMHEEVKANRDFQRQSLWPLTPPISDIAALRRNEVPMIGSGKSKAGESDVVSFVVLGDSHAQVSAFTFHEMALEHGVTGAMLTYPGTPPLKEWNHFSAVGAKNPNALLSEALDYIQRNRVRHVFLVAFWGGYQEQSSADEFEASVVATLNAVKDTGATPYFVVDNPTYQYDVPRRLIRNSLIGSLGDDIEPQTIEAHTERQRGVYQAIEKIGHEFFLDPTPIFLGENGSDLMVKHNGRILIYDTNHMTQYGVDRVFRPLLAPIFEEIQRSRGEANSSK